MDAPKKLFFASYGDIAEDAPITNNDIEYIRKDMLLGWANARKAGLSSGESFVAGERKMLKEIIDKLNSM